MSFKPILPALIFLAASTLSFADDTPEKLKGDIAKFQGTWTTKVGPGKELDAVVVFKDKTVTFSIKTPEGDPFEIKGEFKLDETAKPYKTVDWVKFVGPNGDEIPDNLGIYEFDGEDKLKVCSGGHNNERPTEFKPGNEGPPMTLIMTRKVEPKK